VRFADLLTFPSSLPSSSHSCRRNSKPITAYLYFHGTDLELASHHQLVMDLPGGGFICMSPEHHAERLLRWAKQTGLPILSLDYGKVRRYLPILSVGRGSRSSDGLASVVVY
jgi:acetyl esterase/lipase